MFRAREGQGIAKAGNGSEAVKSFARARSLIQDSSPSDEPEWAWWVTDREIDRQEGRSLQETGENHAAIPVLERAMHRENGADVGYRTVASVRLLDSLIKVRSWKTAENEAEKLLSDVDGMSSIVTRILLGEVAEEGKTLPRAPSGLREALHQLGTLVSEDPYAL
ncbi:hypothetical protein NKH77_31925 [Streptomyces sp. M19]